MKMEFKLSDVQGHALSPGDIFWQQKSGNLVLISAKSDFLNIELVEKLFNSKSILLIENQINFDLQDEFEKFFRNHQKQLLVHEKLQWRKKLISLFASQLASPDLSQNELNQMSWKIFSTIDREKLKGFLSDDIDLFKRSMSVATSYTLCAFVLGYYSETFLTDLFSDTFLSLMDLNKDIPRASIKSQLEKIRTANLLDDEDKEFLDNVYQLKQKKNFVVGERYDGLGVKEISKFEMTDLELLLVALNDHYTFTMAEVGENERSIFFDIRNSFFKCDQKVLSTITRSLNVNNESSPSLISLVG